MNVARFTLAVGCSLLTGCAQPAGLHALPAGGDAVRAGALPSRAGAGSAVVLYAFRPPPDSEVPLSALVAYNGTLYGTAHEGGAYGGGTVFSITTGGSEKRLHDFRGKDGLVPYSELLVAGGRFYGTTYSGGANSNGVVYTITPGGKFRVLHSFAGGTSDGANPQGGVVSIGGTLYGTTSAGGANGDGTVFAITPQGGERVLHSFSGAYGAQPLATLAIVNGTLYGTTLRGGDHNGGTLFRISPSGAFKVLHRFCGPYDGCNPAGALAYLNGALYGTTTLGTVDGYGAVFKATLKGHEVVVHNFTGRKDGCHPYAGLANIGGTLYGTTFGAFAKSQCGSSGTVYRVNAGGYATLHSFAGSDGANPYADPVGLGTKVYGTTEYGGPSGDGVVYAL